jgi:sugar phosphate permease
LELRDQGIAPPVEEICRDRPDLAPAVAASLGLVERLPEMQRRSAQHDALATCEIAGRYRLDARIGAGAMGTVAMYLALGTPAMGWVMVFMSLCIIGVHGMLSGTASMDFGGRRNVGVAVGIIDGFVYAGTAVEALVLGFVLPDGTDKQDPANWWTWPLAMMPITVLGFFLALRVWNARPKSIARPAR